MFGFRRQEKQTYLEAIGRAFGLDETQATTVAMGVLASIEQFKNLNNRERRDTNPDAEKIKKIGQLFSSAGAAERRGFPIGTLVLLVLKAQSKLEVDYFLVNIVQSDGDPSIAQQVLDRSRK